MNPPPSLPDMRLLASCIHPTLHEYIAIFMDMENHVVLYNSIPVILETMFCTGTVQRNNTAITLAGKFD